ncbi:MAG TPA: HpcH/HpaI aldolase/citrate lyase family protein [Alphaproteobacteria bacterium]|nr:HpcH/HpaI aldolase/citrate lyase family protein [Alphaproteobacteria bacterium]
MRLPVNSFKHRLGKGERLFGLWSMSSSPVVAEAMGQVGFDFVVLDMEHAPTDGPRMLSSLQAIAGTPTPALVRIPWNDAVVVKQLLDMGAQSVMFPYVQSADEARRAVASTRYPPAGFRGVAGMSRATRYGNVEDYFRRAAVELCVVVQLETAAALSRLDEIATVDGIDSIFVGPNDLAADMGHIGQTDHPQVKQAIAAAAARCRALGKPCGILAPDATVAGEYIGYGFTWVAAGSDLGLMMAGARGTLEAVRSTRGAAPGDRTVPGRV